MGMSILLAVCSVRDALHCANRCNLTWLGCRVNRKAQVPHRNNFGITSPARWRHVRLDQGPQGSLAGPVNGCPGSAGRSFLWLQGWAFRSLDPAANWRMPPEVPVTARSDGFHDRARDHWPVAADRVALYP
jgi:hypothetical protein